MSVSVIGLPTLRGRFAAPISSPGVDHDEVRFDREPVQPALHVHVVLVSPGQPDLAMLTSTRSSRPVLLAELANRAPGTD